MPGPQCRQCDRPLIVQAAPPMHVQLAELDPDDKIQTTTLCGGCELPETLCDCEPDIVEALNTLQKEIRPLHPFNGAAHKAFRAVCKALGYDPGPEPTF